MRPLKLNSVLVATDLSADDVAAIRTAIALARLAGAKLQVVHAGSDDEQTMAAIGRQIREADPTCEPLPDMVLREGGAERVILDAARRVAADVIVLGPHRSRRAHSPGGTAYQVAAGAAQPCLVLPGEMPLPLGRILVPIDGSEAARGALAVAMTWASALRRRTPPRSPDSTTLVVLHVDTADGSGTSDVLEAAMSAVGDHVSNMAGVRVERLTEAGDDAAAAILERAADGQFDLIVLGTRAGASAGLELGSVTSGVVQSAACPLLLVPPRVWRERGNDPMP